MLLEKGKLDEGRAALEHVPQQSITDPNVFINVGVLFMNQKKDDEAETYFSKAVDTAPVSSTATTTGASPGSASRTTTARGGLQKVVELAPPDSSEVKEAASFSRR